MADDNSVALHLDGNDIPLEKFVEAVDAFSTLIQHVSDAVPKASPLSWATALRPGSLEVVAIPLSNDASASQTASQAVLDGLAAIATESERPAYFDDEALKNARNLASLAAEGKEQGVCAVSVGLNGKSASVDEAVISNVRAYLETPAHAYGTVEGILQRVSPRRGNQCAVYDQRFGYGVECNLSAELMGKALGAFDKRVLVYGRISYQNRRPYRMTVETLETFPDPSTLPSADDMLGILRDDWVPPNERQ